MSAMDEKPQVTEKDEKFASLAPLLERSGPFAVPGFEPVDIQTLGESTRVLVVGAGGLGCEILKDLALSGFTDIHVIDLDTIDVSNLNRQFLFRKKDVGQPKATVAAAFIEKRCKGVKCTPYTKKIQEFGRAWYKKFDVVVAGLDNVEARSWLNETLCDLVQYDDDGDVMAETIIPLIDGGTEGFSGQARVFLPRLTSCFECSMASMPEEKGHFHLCTLANVPRIPEHCIQWALVTQWPLLEELKSANDYKIYQKKNDKDETAPSLVTLDKDDVHHMTWIFNRAAERAAQFGIQGVTYHLTMQVVKHIIPAIASTNALISAACVNEAFKFRTRAAFNLNNYLMYMGQQQTGTHSDTFKYKRNPDCRVCRPPILLTLDKQFTLKQLVDKLVKEHGLDGPTLISDSKVLYQSVSASSYSEDFLKVPVSDLIRSKEQIRATDVQRQLKKVIITFN